MASRTVLVVDDEEEIRELCRVNLEFEGFDVIEAADGAAALRLARAARPDLIFLDLVMPVIGGWEVLRQLKQDADTANIPVIILTAKSGGEEQARGWQEGVLEFVSKPFNPLSLAERAARACQDRPVGEEEQNRQQIFEQIRLLQDVGLD